MAQTRTAAAGPQASYAIGGGGGGGGGGELTMLGDGETVLITTASGSVLSLRVEEGRRLAGQLNEHCRKRTQR